MSSRLEYHYGVRRFLPSSFALLALLALPVFVASSHAQINGTPSSVTSPGFGGHTFNGTAPSVTSVGPHGYAPTGQATFNTWNGVPFAANGTHHDNGHNGNGSHHHHTDYALPYAYYAVPYAIDMGAAGQGYDNNAPDADDEDNYQGGPTIFDRRGDGADSYIPPVSKMPHPHASESAEAAMADPSTSDVPPVPTLLVFKDGHKLEVGNYAIVGATLFDLTPGHARKVALTDLDLDATQKQNDDRGVFFSLPPAAQAN